MSDRHSGYVYSDESGPITRAPENTDELARTLALLVGRLNRRIRGQGKALHHGHLSAMATLQKAGPLRLKDLAARENTSPPSMTRTVTDLEERGLVRRDQDAADRRSIVVTLTHDGVDTVLRARSERAAILRNLIDQLTEEQRASLTAALPALEVLSETGLN